MNITHEEVVAAAKDSVAHIVNLTNEVFNTMYRSVYLGELTATEIEQIYREGGIDLSETQVMFLRMAEKAQQDRESGQCR